MPRYRTAYPPEFRRQMLDLVRSGRGPQSSGVSSRGGAADKRLRQGADHSSPETRSSVRALAWSLIPITTRRHTSRSVAQHAQVRLGAPRRDAGDIEPKLMAVKGLGD